MNKTLIENIRSINEVELDIIWTLLKRKDLRITRKLVCIGYVLGVSEDIVLNEARTSEDGRVLNQANRMDIHDALIRYENS